MVDKREKMMKSFKVGDWVTTWDTGLAMWKRGVVEAVRTENQDWCGTGTVRVLWDVNKRGYWVPEWRLKHIKDQPKPKQSKPKIAVGDLVEVQGIGRRNRGIVTVAGTSELTLRCGDGIHYGYVSTAVLIKTAAEVQKMFDDCPTPAPKQTTVFSIGDVVDRYDERGNFVARGIVVGKILYQSKEYLSTLEKGEIVGPVLPEDLVLVAKRQDLRGLDSVLANMGQPSKPRKP